MKISKRKRLFKAKVPDLDSFIGKTVEIKGEKIKIETIVGNIGLTIGRAPKYQRPQFYEINGSHLISMLRFHAQMEGAKDITEEDFKAFEEMEFWLDPVQQGDPKYEKTAEQIVDDLMKNAKVD